MFNQLLPRRIDNTYSGHKAALWIFGLLVAMNLTMSLNSIFNGYAMASSADGIPLQSYPPAAAGTIVSLFSICGLAWLMICLLCLLVLVRYRGMIPFMFALLLLEHLSRKLILHFMPIVRSRTPPVSGVSLAVIGLMLIGMALSLWRQRNLQVQSSSEVTR
jgi:hypothetical protein